MNTKNYNVLLIEDKFGKIGYTKDLLGLSNYPENLERLQIAQTLEEAKKKTADLLKESNRLAVILDSHFPNKQGGEINQKGGMEYVIFLKEFLKDNPAYIHLIFNSLDADALGGLEPHLVQAVKGVPGISYDRTSENKGIFTDDFSKIFHN